MNANHLIQEESFINGEWVKGKNTFEVINPAKNEVISNVANLTIEDVKKAINSASTAWISWRKTTAQQRGGLLTKWFILINDHKEELAEIMTLESGKPL